MCISSYKMETRTRTRIKLEVPIGFQYTDRMKNKIDTRTDFELLGITYLPYPKGCDGDVVAEIIADDQYDIIFLDKGIVCKNDRVKDVKAAIKEAKED